MLHNATCAYSTKCPSIKPHLPTTSNLTEEDMELEFPPLFLLRFRIPDKEFLELEREIGDDHDGILVRDVREAKVVMGRVTQKSRAQHELRKLQLYTEEVIDEKIVEQDERKNKVNDKPRAKKRKIEKRKDGKEVITVDSSTEPEDESSLRLRSRRRSPGGDSSPVTIPSSVVALETSSPASYIANQEDLFGGDTLKVVRLDWYYDSVEAGFLLPTAEYLVYEGHIIDKLKKYDPPSTTLPSRKGKEILERARADTPPRSQPSYPRYKHRRSGSPNSQPKTQRIQLLHESTSDHEQAADLPQLPSYLLPGTYSCERPTPPTCPNDAFLSQLKIIKLQRKLVRNDKGVSHLAYSRAIAAIAAYPYTITVPQEVGRLPSCGDKYVGLYQEWRDTGMIREVEEIEADERVKSLKIFYDIYDVGEKTAREFYDKGWRDLDDVIQYGWKDLPQNQQIFVKYYDDFQEKICRNEVKRIGAVVHRYANKIRPGFQSVICGGYRRGNALCGDVDVVVTHPDPGATRNFIEDIVEELIKDKWITHVLRFSTANSDRGEEPVSWKGSMAKAGAGFDTLDKAFLVWQDADLLTEPVEGRVNLKRRVDIIVSPWKTAGCAIVGWSGGNQFERDLRSYCRHKKGLKFDSTGVRRLSDGVWVDLEGNEKTLLGKEKKVFAGLGLEWREPTERCTG